MGNKCDKKEVSEDNEACWVATITKKQPRFKFYKSGSKFKAKVTR